MIIDAHGHLGNILYKNGGQLIHRRGDVKEKRCDPQDLSEKMLMRSWGVGKVIYLFAAKTGKSESNK